MLTVREKQVAYLEMHERREARALERVAQKYRDWMDVVTDRIVEASKAADSDDANRWSHLLDRLADRMSRHIQHIVEEGI